jgi:hypothetical protein
MGRAERRAEQRAQGRSVREVVQGLQGFARQSERYLTVLGRNLPAEWVRHRDAVGHYWSRGNTMVRATLKEPGPDGWARAVASVSLMGAAVPSRPPAALVREVARVFLGAPAEHLPQVDTLPGGLAVMVECDVMVVPRAVGQA